jgi:hypothetical protein
MKRLQVHALMRVLAGTTNASTRLRTLELVSSLALPPCNLTPEEVAAIAPIIPAEIDASRPFDGHRPWRLLLHGAP